MERILSKDQGQGRRFDWKNGSNIYQYREKNLKWIQKKQDGMDFTESLPITPVSPILSRYRQLWKIEEAFRFNKHDLKMRPVYHWKPDRIKSHGFVIWPLLSRFTIEKINRGREERLDERPLSFARCIEELSRVESHIVKNVGDESDKNLYVLPPNLIPEQQDIYTALGVEIRPFCL